MRPLTRTSRRHYSSVNRWRVTLDKLTAAASGAAVCADGQRKNAGHRRLVRTATSVMYGAGASLPIGVLLTMLQGKNEKRPLQR
jgi:hypothetical protein